MNLQHSSGVIRTPSDRARRALLRRADRPRVVPLSLLATAALLLFAASVIGGLLLANAR
jgi:hypothetical protein